MQDKHSEPLSSVSASSCYFFQYIPIAPLDIGIRPVWDNEKEQLAQSQHLLDLGPKQVCSLWAWLPSEQNVRSCFPPLACQAQVVKEAPASPS